MRCPMLVAVLCVVLDAGAVAQAPPLAPGQRVRVTAAAADLHKVVATFQALEGDVLVLVVDTIMRVPVTAVERLDVYAGSHSNALAGGAVGFIVGMAAGAVFASQFTSETPGAPLLAPIGGLAFALLGTGLGALTKTDTWTHVPAERLRMGVGSSGGRVAVMASVPF